MTFITVASATLPSIPLDFQGNLQRILESIRLAKSQGAKLRTGPEVGYLTETQWNETDLFSWKFLDMGVLIITVSQAHTLRYQSKSC
jgi:NAD+ synthase (glutamine-hydrolysing)